MYRADFARHHHVYSFWNSIISTGYFTGFATGNQQCNQQSLNFPSCAMIRFWLHNIVHHGHVLPSLSLLVIWNFAGNLYIVRHSLRSSRLCILRILLCFSMDCANCANRHILHKSIRHFASQPSPPKNGIIALCPNTRVVKCKYCVSQKRNEAKWFNVLTHFYI